MQISIDNEQKRYAVLDYSDYLKLDMLAKLKGEVKSTIISTNDLLFLASVMQKLSANYESELSVINDTITIKVCKDNGSEINSTFDLSICEKYYNRINAFICEVL